MEQQIKSFLPGHSEISFGGIEYKKVFVFFDELEKCFSMEENIEAAKRTQLCRTGHMLMGGMEEEKLLFFYLLEKLQAMVRIKLGEYWHMCDPTQESDEKSDNRRIRWKQKNWRTLCEGDNQLLEKQNKYMECFMTIALHEIFARECERQCGVLQEGFRVRKESLENVKEKISEIVEVTANVDEEGIRAWTENADGNIQKMKEYTKWLSRYVVLLNIYLEHVIGVETELLLIMILETKNLGMLKGDTSFGQQVAADLKCMKDKNTESFMQYNKNRAKYYKQLEYDMKETFLCFMQRISERERQNFAEAMQTYLTIVETGKLDEEKCKSLWVAQCILVMPVWMSSS